ncbi:hypothetical protein GCM10023205_26720 [Yinghuangia aomiensis]|uniref:Uncharacterized protein n=1 Tax=Yinghuangia aomiensis TaxID=676205 RepID=A0ABP9H410_9ACTN
MVGAGCSRAPSAADHAAGTGLGRRRFDRWIDKAIGLPVSGTVTGWTGPARELQAPHDTVAYLAPHVPCCDPTGDTHRRRLRLDLADRHGNGVDVDGGSMRLGGRPLGIDG